MTLWNAGFVSCLLAVSSFLAWNDPGSRAGRAHRRGERTAERKQARARDEARQADLDAINRHHRTMLRLYGAGHHPALAGPPRLPGDPAAGPVGPGLPSAGDQQVTPR